MTHYVNTTNEKPGRFYGQYLLGDTMELTDGSIWEYHPEVGWFPTQIGAVTSKTNPLTGGRGIVTDEGVLMEFLAAPVLGGVLPIYLVPPPGTAGIDDAPMLRLFWEIPNAWIVHAEGVYNLGTRYGSSEELKHILAPANGLRAIGKGGRSGATKFRVADTLPTNSAIVSRYDGSDITIEGIEFDGNKQRLTALQVGAEENEGLNWKGKSTRIKLWDVWIHDCGQDCIDFDPTSGVDAASNLSSGCTIDECVLENSGGMGIHNGCRGLKVRDSIIRGNAFERFGHGVTPYGGFDIAENDIEVTGTQITGNAARQLVVDTVVNPIVTGTKLRDLIVTAGSGTPCMLMMGGSTGVEISGGVWTGAAGEHCIQGITGTVGTVIRGANIASPSTTKNAINITGDATQLFDNIITGSYRGAALSGNNIRVLGNNRFSGQVNDSLYISAGSGALIQGGTFTGAVAGKSITLNSNGGHKVIDNNIGYGVSGFTGNTVKNNVGVIREASGTATILDTTSFITISHGLTNSGITGISPVTVQITPQANATLWVSARSTSSFTVTRSGTSGALAFDWSASA